MLYGSPRLSDPRTLRTLNEQPFHIVSLAEAKQHLRVEVADDDDYITNIIKAAQDYCEKAMDRTLLVKRLEATWDGFPVEIRLPKPPIYRASPLFVISYIDGTGASQLLATSDYRVEYSEPAVLRPPYSETWPTALADVSSVTISWQAGYGTAPSDVPEGIRCAALMVIAHLYERRMAYDTVSAIEVPLGVKSLLAMHSWGSYR